jgi:hypothetical protein
MKYAQPFNLRCHAVLVEYFERRSHDFNNDRGHAFPILDIAPEIRDLFNDEMTDRGLPQSYSWMLFKKKNHTNEDVNQTHVDTVNEVARVSIVIPLSGYEDTYMYWCEGDHYIDQSPKIDNTMTYGRPIWNDYTKVNVVHREMIVSPTICRVEVPHDTVTRLDGSYRVVITARFEGNPSFEEVCEKLSG